MNNQTTKAFDLRDGWVSLSQSGQLFMMYLFVVAGILSHWIYEIAIAALDSGQWDFGSLGIVAARLVIAVIVGLVSFTGIWKQLEKLDPSIRVFAAITQGFALDALAAPLAHAAT